MEYAPVDHGPGAFARIGQIIAEWSGVHEFIHSQIGHIQTAIYLRNKRQWMADNPGQEPPMRLVREAPDPRFRLKLKYYRRLVLAAAGTDSPAIRELDGIVQRVHAAYAMRNVLAHGQIIIAGSYDPPAIRVHYREWLEKWEKSVAAGDRPRKPEIIEAYSFDELDALLVEIVSLRNALYSLSAQVPHFGAPVQPPQKPA